MIISSVIGCLDMKSKQVDMNDMRENSRQTSITIDGQCGESILLHGRTSTVDASYLPLHSSHPFCAVPNFQSINLQP